MWRSALGSLQLQAASVDLHVCRVCRSPIVSPRKVKPFRRFHNCQQHNKVKVSKWAAGIFAGHGRQRTSATVSCAVQVTQIPGSVRRMKQRCSERAGGKQFQVPRCRVHRYFPPKTYGGGDWPYSGFGHFEATRQRIEPWAARSTSRNLWQCSQIGFAST